MMIKITVFIPILSVDVVKSAMFEAGAGKIGNYDSCCWQVLGQGQFRPLKGSKPSIGYENTIEIVEEYKVEMVCEEHLASNIISAMLAVHPYEEPAYDVIRLITVKELSI